MLTGYVFCIPLKSKQASEVLQAYIDNVYAKFGSSLKILSDNGTEFKNQLFEKIAKELGVKHKIYTTPYRPSSYGCICRATTRPPRPSSTAECLRLIARLRGEQASAASWEPRPPFEAAEMD